MEKVLYVVYVGNMSEEVADMTGYGDVFSDENGDIISFVHENDGDWRGEYFNDVLKHFGVCVEKPDVTMLNIIETKFKTYMGVE